MAERNKAGLVLGTVVAIAAVEAMLASRPVKAAPGGIVSLDEATMNLLIAIAQEIGVSTEEVIAELRNIISAVNNISLGGGLGIAPNTESITATRVVIGALFTPVQLPDISVPDQMILLIKAWYLNAGIIFVGESALASNSPNSVWSLVPNEFVGYRIQNANALWITGNAIGDSVVVTVEQRRS